MTLKLNSPTSGSVSLDAPNTTGGAAVTLTLPVDDGDADQYLKTDGSGALSFATISNTISSGTYTSIGTSTHKDITVDSTDVVKYEILFQGISCGGGTDWQFQLGDSGGIETSGYEVVSDYTSHNTSGRTSARTDGWRWYGTGDSNFIMDGKFTLTRINSNIWWGEGQLIRTEAGSTLYTMCGSKSLSAALTTIQISASSDDSESFDAGNFKLITYK